MSTGPSSVRSDRLLHTRGSTLTYSAPSEDWKKTDFSALIDTIPTQLALVFFGLLHVPINVPALGISVGEDNVNTNRELVAHGISNVAAGLLGTVPNYLCYVNSVLFYKVGGTTRLSGFLLALASFGVLVAGPGIISVLPVCVVGALIFILGIDLVKEVRAAGARLQRSFRTDPTSPLRRPSGTLTVESPASSLPRSSPSSSS